MSLEDFAESVKSTTLRERRAAVKSELGADLKATTKKEAVPEAYALFLAKDEGSNPAPEKSPNADNPEKSPNADPVADAKAQAEANAKAEAEAKAARVAKDTADQKERQADPPVELVYEGRSRTGMLFHKGGRIFGKAWAPIGTLTEAECTQLDKFKQFVDYRIRG